jgi:RNA polymerase sigma factor (sigma-70 family)
MDQLAVEISWQTYIRTQSSVLRDELIKHYISFARSVVWKKCNEMKSGLAELDDLINAGYMGLIQAFDSFDPTVGYGPIDSRFTAWSRMRIWGSPIDEARRFSELPYRYTKKKVMCELSKEIGFYEGDFTTEILNEKFPERFGKRIMNEGLFDLSDIQKEVLYDYFYTGMSYAMIAEKMGSNKDRVINIKKGAIIKMRSRIENENSKSIMTEYETYIS